LVSTLMYVGSLQQTPVSRGGTAVFRGAWHCDDVDVAQANTIRKYVESTAEDASSQDLHLDIFAAKRPVASCAWHAVNPETGASTFGGGSIDSETFDTIFHAAKLDKALFGEEAAAAANWNTHLSPGWPWQLKLEERASPLMLQGGLGVFNPWVANLHSLDKWIDPVVAEPVAYNEDGQPVRQTKIKTPRFSAFVRLNGEPTSTPPQMITEARQRKSNAKSEDRLQSFLDRVSSAMGLTVPARALYTAEGKKVAVRGNELVVPPVKGSDSIRPELWVAKGNEPFSSPSVPNSAYTEYRKKMLRKKEKIARINEIAQPKSAATLRVWARWNGAVAGLVQPVMCRGADMLNLMESCTAQLPARGRAVQRLFTEKGDPVKSFLDLGGDAVVWCGFKGEPFRIPGDSAPAEDVLTKTIPADRLARIDSISKPKVRTPGKADREMRLHVNVVPGTPVNEMFQYGGVETQSMTHFMATAKVGVTSIQADTRRILDGQTRFFT